MHGKVNLTLAFMLKNYQKFLFRVKRWAYQIILHCSASQVILSAQQQPEPSESSSSSNSDHDLSLMLLKLSDKSGCELSDDKLGSENDEPKAYTTSKFDFDSML